MEWNWYQTVIFTALWCYHRIYMPTRKPRGASMQLLKIGVIARRSSRGEIQYIPRNMHTVFALLCFVLVIQWLIFPYPSGLLHWHCGNLTIAPVPAKQPWWIWINTSCEFIMNDCITTTKQSTTKPCAYFLGYTVARVCLRSTYQHGIASNYIVVVTWPVYSRRSNMCKQY